MKNELWKNTNVTIFNYGFNKVRTIVRDGEPWFVLKDVCDVLEISNSRNVSERLDSDEKADVRIMDTSSNGTRQNRDFTIINESGMYSVILLSRKPEAKEFKRWLTHEVLPSIRKTGSYYLAPRSYIDALKALIAAEEEKQQLAQENSELQIELDRDKQYYTVKRVAKLNKINWRTIDWRSLKQASHAMEKTIKKVFDPNLEKVNAYHIDVWQYEYPHLRYE